MALCNITEIQELAKDLNGTVIQAVGSALGTQDVTGLSSSPQSSDAFNQHTAFIRINPEVTIRYAVLTSGSVGAQGTRLPAEAVEIVGVPINKGAYISVRTA
jgi:hypothetical protein